jgi:hypothetical protein
MGGIIIDGRAALRFEGTVAELRKVLDEVASLSTQARGLEIQLQNPGSASATIVGLHFRGSMSDFEPVLKGLKKIRASVAIDTVPLPESPAIGTWPTPELGSTAFGWTVMASV